MKVSQQQFDDRLKKNQLILSFIGMSNTGKTHWSKKLEEMGFQRMSCDDGIEKKLARTLKKRGYRGIEDVSRWMGQPYDKRFRANQQKYLQLEKETMQSIFNRIHKENAGNTIIDTTGSIVHTGKNTCEKLKRHSIVVYIEVTKGMEDAVYADYIRKPKPVVFGNAFTKRKTETDKQTLARCYRKLLKKRTALYAGYADISIPYAVMAKNKTAKQCISLIKRSL